MIIEMPPNVLFAATPAPPLRSILLLASSDQGVVTPRGRSHNNSTACRRNEAVTSNVAVVHQQNRIHRLRANKIPTAGPALKP